MASDLTLLVGVLTLTRFERSGDSTAVEKAVDSSRGVENSLAGVGPEFPTPLPAHSLPHSSRRARCPLSLRELLRGSFPTRALPRSVPARP
jgi:hypothetical protein